MFFIFLFQIISAVAFFFHVSAAYMGIKVFGKYESAMQKKNARDMFTVKHVWEDFMVRRLHIISITTMTSILFSIKLLESMVNVEMHLDEWKFFLEWAAVDLMTGVSIFLLHLDMFKDRRGREEKNKEETTI